MGGWRFGGCILGPRSDGGRWLEHGWGFIRGPASCKFKQSFSFYSNSALTENVIRWSHNLATELWRISQASHDINHRGNYSSRKYFCLLSHWHTCYSNLVRFVRDMMNIHDPDVPAASGKCPQQGLPMVPCQVSSVLTTYPITELTEESFNNIRSLWCWISNNLYFK